MYMFVSLHVCVCTCLRVYMYAGMYAGVYVFYTSECTSVHTHMCSTQFCVCGDNKVYSDQCVSTQG